MTTDTAQTVIYDQVRPITDVQVVSIIPPGQVEASQVGIVLTVSGIDQPIALTIQSRRALNQLVESLMRHGDEAFSVGRK